MILTVAVVDFSFTSTAVAVITRSPSLVSSLPVGRVVGCPVTFLPSIVQLIGSLVPLKSTALPMRSIHSPGLICLPSVGEEIRTSGAVCLTPSALATASRALIRSLLPSTTPGRPTPSWCAVSRRMAQMSSRPRPGSAALTSAATPATNGLAKLVPDMDPVVGYLGLGSPTV